MRNLRDSGICGKYTGVSFEGFFLQRLSLEDFGCKVTSSGFRA